MLSAISCLTKAQGDRIKLRQRKRQTRNLHLSLCSLTSQLSDESFFKLLLSFSKKGEVLHAAIPVASHLTINRLESDLNWHGTLVWSWNLEAAPLTVCVCLFRSLWKPLCLSDGLTSLSLQPQRIGYTYFKCMCFCLSMMNHLILHD